MPPFVQRGRSIGSFLSGLFRAVRPILWSGVKDFGKATLKALVNEALRTGGKILTGIADNPNVGAREIISWNVTDSLINLSAKMSRQGQRKRKRSGTTSQNCKRGKRTKRSSGSRKSPPKNKKVTRTMTTKRNIS